ncbi:MAG: hypothetical protein K2K04_01710, partial [Clostridia bacterium]|nr:hypothetical protein [Clostridia bacterium]
MAKKVIKQTILMITSLFLCLVLVFGMSASILEVFAAADSTVKAAAAEALNDEAFNDEVANAEAVTDLSNDVMSLSDDDVLYLSDRSRIVHDKSSFSLGNTRLWMAPSQKDNIPNKAAQAKIEGAWY